MNHQSNILLLNRSCYPNCPICASNSSDDISLETAYKILDVIKKDNKEVYIGMEAFKDVTILRNILIFCKERRLMPIVLTRGIFAQDIDEIEKIIRDLLSEVTFRMLIVVDNQHLNLIGYNHLCLLLKAIRKSTCTIPEVLYLLREDETISAALLEEEEINKFLTIYSHKAESLISLLTGSGYAESSCFLELIPTTPTSENNQILIENLKENSLQIPSQCLTNNNELMKEYQFSFNALVIETTHLCNASCKHCYLSCGPDADPERMPIFKVKQLIDEASTLSNIKKHLHLGGGEATIYWEEVIEILKYAKMKGFTNSIVTNGFWGVDPNQVLSKVAELKRAGVFEIEFSVDAMHNEFVSPDAISNIIRAAKKAGIKVVLRMCTTKVHTAADLLKNISIDDQRDIIIAISKVVPVGRARFEIPLRDLWVDPGIPIGACYQVLNLTVTPNGDIFPCCVGGESCRSLKLGNYYDQSLKDIMKSIRVNFLVRTLIYTGPAYYAALIQQEGLGNKLLSHYSNYCHLCNHIFTDPELEKVINLKINQKVVEILMSTLTDSVS